MNNHNIERNYFIKYRFKRRNYLIIIYKIKQDIHIYVAYSRPNGWTEWAEFFSEHLWVAVECYRPNIFSLYLKSFTFVCISSSTLFSSSATGRGAAIGSNSKKKLAQSFFYISKNIFPM